MTAVIISRPPTTKLIRARESFDISISGGAVRRDAVNLTAPVNGNHHFYTKSLHHNAITSNLLDWCN
jgi:hypothetical protein